MFPVIMIGLLAIVALAGGTATWVFFGLATWGVLHMILGGDRRRARRRMRYTEWMAVQQQRQAPAPAPPPPAPPPPPIAAPQPATSLPEDVRKQVDRIRRKSAVLGRMRDKFPMGSKDLFVVQQTEADYLPTTVNAYLQVPPWSVEAPGADGKTPLQMLHEQLDLQEAKLDQIFESVKQQRVDNLAAHGRFLEEAIGPGDEELTIPSR